MGHGILRRGLRPRVGLCPPVQSLEKDWWPVGVETDSGRGRRQRGSVSEPSVLLAQSPGKGLASVRRSAGKRVAGPHRSHCVKLQTLRLTRGTVRRSVYTRFRRLPSVFDLYRG